MVLLMALPLGAALLVAPACAEDLPAEAAGALRRAVTFFRTRVSADGGYLWRYSDDLTLREGEVKAGERTVWVQPPGTPAVGLALLEAHAVTGDRLYLDAARDAARVLLRGQLRSGGWTYSIELDPAERKGNAYRVDPPRERQRDVSTLDDDTTQVALRFLVRIDRALGLEDGAIHEAAAFGLSALLAAQFPGGGFPQGFDGPVERLPPRRASYPDDWPRVWPGGRDYWRLQTLNDDLALRTLDLLLEASSTYKDAKYLDAARRLGDFLLLAQMPEPQPAWAQQYDAAMCPAWARKFEPPAVTGGESQGVLLALLRLAEETRDARYLEPLPRAMEYLQRSVLPGGRLARFHELRTNSPLYFTRSYELTHDDGDLPTHYAFTVGSRLERIATEYERVKQSVTAGGAPTPRESPAAARTLAAGARRAIAALDAEGRWVEEGSLRSGPSPTGRIIDSATFIRNVETLSLYLAASRR
jgi:PelA/Pel-15E family pectate lyase